MANAKTTSLIAESDGYFAWNLDSGGVRILMFGCAHVDLPIGHPKFNLVKTASRMTVESVFDDVYSYVHTRSE